MIFHLFMSQGFIAERSCKLLFVVFLVVLMWACNMFDLYDEFNCIYLLDELPICALSTFG